MSLPRADILPDLIALTSPQERSPDPLQRTFAGTLHYKTISILVDVNEYL